MADGRSPIARNWIADYAHRGFDVHLISTFACDARGLGLASVTVVPVALARLAGGGASRPTASASDERATRGAATFRRARAAASAALLPTVLGWLAPFDLAPHARRVRDVVREIDPALVHAMRVPYEGILAALALAGSDRPLVTSIWGNDLELWASRYPLVGRLTRRALARATALHPDCARDLRLAASWGWDDARPSSVIPGNGGVRADVFHPGPADPALLARHGLPTDAPIVLNARGFRGYVRNDTFFRAIPLVLERRPDAVFAGVGMRGHPAAIRATQALGVERAVRLLPSVPPEDMAGLFRSATAAVSPAVFDGTPNTLLEAMACGALPVAGDIASVREWIDDGRNGLLFDPSDARALAVAIIRALDDAPLRADAAARNAALVAERADFRHGMRRADALYADALHAATLGAATRPGAAGARAAA
ncbi:MAG TPA: glycosyltransferase family 4 protein [Gemmatirosa sp.]